MYSEEEKAIVDSGDIKRLERTLEEIELNEESLIKEFDRDAEDILGVELIKKLNITNSAGVINSRILTNLHKSMIENPDIRILFEKRLSMWFSKKTLELKKKFSSTNSFSEVKKDIPYVFALASLALTSFHTRPNMHLRDVQKLASIAMVSGDIAELGTGEGKTLAGVLPTFFHALRGKGAHVITANSYLSKRDYDELRPIFEGLGLSVGYLPESEEDLARIEGLTYENLPYDKKKELNKRLVQIKKNAYSSDVTYGSKASFAFDYLRDCIAEKREDLLQREENPGFALIDEVDDVLIDDAQCPYVLGGNIPVYSEGMTLPDLAGVLHVPFDELYENLRSVGVKIDKYQKLSYDEARNISLGFYYKELIPDSYSYQKRAQSFLEQRVLPYIYVVDEKNEFGINPSDLYENLTRNEKDYRFSPREKQILERCPIIYYPAQKKFHVQDKCYEDFLSYCYFAFQMSNVVSENEREILDDPSYILGKDYNIVSGKVSLTYDGAKRIIKDEKHKAFANSYSSYMGLVNPFASEILHYFNQAIVANITLHPLEDYIVDNEQIKVVKNGRVQDGSVFTEGLQQALEHKEHIPRRMMTKENKTAASITQKDFYGRYDAFSGMTGTSSKKIFREIFDKNTVCIPRNSFYEYYSNYVKRKKRNTKVAPYGVERRNTKLALNREDKINLIIKSIQKSLSSPYPQPVLLVTSNPEELELMSRELEKAGIKHDVLNAKIDKTKEAEIIAKAGLPGAVTLTTEMAGRGTDIKLGGDRETVIDIAVERYIRRMEAKLNKAIQLKPFEREELRKEIEKFLIRSQGENGERFLWSREEEEKSRENLARLGLKVISSGYFKVDRIDRQLEGRTGRNNFSGICERYACPSDFEYIGIKSLEDGKTVRESLSKFSRTKDGSLVVDERSLKVIENRVKIEQSNNEAVISNNIKNTQELSYAATKVVERYREDRKKILLGHVNLDLRIQNMFEDTVDNLLASYIKNKFITEDILLSSLNSGIIDLDIETFALEAKEILGINIDFNTVLNSGANILELRNAILSYANSEYLRLKNENPNLMREKATRLLLAANDDMISNIPTILQTSTTQKSLVGLSSGLEGQMDAIASKNFDSAYQEVKLISCKNTIKRLFGSILSVSERKELEKRKEALFGLKVGAVDEDGVYDVRSSSLRENDKERKEAFRKIAKDMNEKTQEQLQKADKRAKKLLLKGETDDHKLTSLYDNLSVRHAKFIEAAAGDLKFRLVRIQPKLAEEKNVGYKK